MPELPEVETIKSDLRSLIIGKEILDVKSEYPDIVKDIDFDDFKREVVGKKILKVRRRAKNLIIELVDSRSSLVEKPTNHKPQTTNYLLIHLKMTGHLIVTDASREVKDGSWVTKVGPLSDPQNQYIRIQFMLSGDKQLAFSDLRKFAYIKLIANSEQLRAILSDYGPEPFDKEFTLEYLKELFGKKKTAIKKVIMDQKGIAGIGNIYADEILFDSRIHPLRAANSLSDKEIENFRASTCKILKKAIELRGTSTSDYRDVKGEKGSYGDIRLMYKRDKENCPGCGGEIKKIKVGGRGTHFCPNCQRQ